MGSRLSLGFLGFLGLLILTYQEIRTWPDGSLHTYVLDVGQGDSIFLISPSGKQILMDGGPDLSALEGIAGHMSFFDRTIDLLVLSHPDLDHIASFPEITERYRIGAILLSGIDTQQPQYQKLLTRIAEKNIPVIIADPKQDIVFEDGLTLDVVWPDHASRAQLKKVNDTSVVIRVLYKEGSMLLTGDIEEKAEDGILKTGADIRSNILKVAHHGSKTSTSTGFLLAVNPDLAVISVGGDNQFGHPHWGVMKRLEKVGIEVLRTDEMGEIHLVLGNKGNKGFKDAERLIGRVGYLLRRLRFAFDKKPLPYIPYSPSILKRNASNPSTSGPIQAFLAACGKDPVPDLREDASRTPD